MTTAFLLAAIIFGVAVLIVLGFFGKRLNRPMKQKYFEARWSELLAMVKSQEGMVLAVIDADKLLDEALKRRGYKGKTMGERLVAAQRDLTSNDSVWYAHKLRNRLVHEPKVRLRKSEAKNALAGIRRGLKDLGAI